MTQHSLETRLVQLGNRSDQRTGAVNPPIYLSTAYEHEGLGKSTGYDYTRTKNPTRQLLEEGIVYGTDMVFFLILFQQAVSAAINIFRKQDLVVRTEQGKDQLDRGHARAARKACVTAF